MSKILFLNKRRLIEDLRYMTKVKADIKFNCVKCMVAKQCNLDNENTAKRLFDNLKKRSNRRRAVTLGSETFTYRNFRDIREFCTDSLKLMFAKNYLLADLRKFIFAKFYKKLLNFINFLKQII